MANKAKKAPEPRQVKRRQEFTRTLNTLELRLEDLEAQISENLATVQRMKELHARARR
ncbi:MAG TPA: hypothetical protein VF988_06605 [Verrucomicrobiae bacterium]